MDLKERIARFRNMAEADPSNELAHFSLGKLLVEDGAHQEAEASLRRTLELAPEHTQAHRFLGEALLGQGRKDEAVEVLRAGALLAHRRGEFQPRDLMLQRLRHEGVEVSLPGSEVAGSPAAAEDGFRCRRCLRANPPLKKAPLSSALGNEILASICQSCWREWLAMGVKVINEYRLNLASPQGSEIYETHMREYLGIG
jgi:Fe-S cluster biosynthesis and repair protein YggX